MVNKIHFGKRMSVLRRKAGLSQTDLAEKLGVTSQAVSKWECGISYIDRYRFDPHSFPDTYRNLAQTSISTDLPSGKVPTTRVRLRISRFMRSMTLFVRIFS